MKKFTLKIEIEEVDPSILKQLGGLYSIKCEVPDEIIAASLAYSLHHFSETIMKFVHEKLKEENVDFSFVDGVVKRSKEINWKECSGGIQMFTNIKSQAND